MHPVAIIGLGSMGSMLAEGFISSDGLAASDVVLSTRTKPKLDEARAKWPGVRIAGSNAEAAATARHVFVCVRPADVKAVLQEILPALRMDTHIISIAGPVPLAAIQAMTGCAATKVGPTVVSKVRGGVTLVCHGENVSREDAAFVEKLLGGIGGVKVIPERDYDLAIELTSCMPGFIASIFQEIVESALRHSETIARPDAEDLVLQTLLGTARLLVEKGIGFNEAIARVATPGGITEEGVKLLRARLPGTMDELFDRTLQKRKLVQEKIHSKF